jgi:lipid-binding SYLF domain-containing protein
MKQIISLLLLAALTMPAAAVTKADLDARIRKLAAKFESLQAKPDKKIPADKLKKAKGIVLLERTKAGLIFAFQGGSGVALLKKGDSWSAPAFMQANEASLGFLVGGQQSFVVALLMHTNAVNMLAEGKFTFGGEASGTAGDKRAAAEGALESDETPMLIYSEVAGLYGGAAVKGGGLAADTDANLAYYEDYLTVKDILTAKEEPEPSAAVKRLKESLTKALK